MFFSRLSIRVDFQIGKIHHRTAKPNLNPIEEIQWISIVRGATARFTRESSSSVLSLRAHRRRKPLIRRPTACEDGGPPRGRAQIRSRRSRRTRPTNLSHPRHQTRFPLPVSYTLEGNRKPETAVSFPQIHRCSINYRSNMSINYRGGSYPSRTDDRSASSSADSGRCRPAMRNDRAPGSGMMAPGTPR